VRDLPAVRARRDAMADPIPLNDGWVKVFDAGSGRSYYANPGSGQTAWELPPGV
jgi:hypothetical protein